jgi:ATP-dependent DNA ligase
MTKRELILKERKRLDEIFKDVDDKKRELVDKLIDQAAFISVESAMLQEAMAETGMVKIHPKHKDIQKPVEAARQYRQNTNSYAVIIKTLNSILTKDSTGEEDPFDLWLEEKRKQDTTAGE